MEKPKLEDFDLSEEKLKFCEDFKEKSKRNEEKYFNIILFTFYFLLVFFSFIFLENKNFEGFVFSLFLSIFLLFFGPYFLAEWLGKKINLYFLSISEKNKLCKKIEENNEKYRDALNKHKKYLFEIEQEKLKKEIESNFKKLASLKDKIFNQSLNKENYVYFLDFKKTLQKLEENDIKEYIKWDNLNEVFCSIIDGISENKDSYFNQYKEYKKYFESRIRQLQNQKDNLKNVQKFLKEEEKNNLDTEKIEIEELEQNNSEDNHNNDIERKFIGEKVDFEEINKQNISLGLLGEKAVIEYEKEILSRKGRNDLAEKVRHISEEEGAGTGYDILSFNIDGTLKYIEVKTTKGGQKTQFILSENEIAFMEENPESCSLYRLYNFDENTKTGKLFIVNNYEKIKEKFNFRPTQFKVKIK